MYDKFESDSVSAGVSASSGWIETERGNTMYTSISVPSLCLSLSLSPGCVCSELKWERGRNINGRRREDKENEGESEGGERGRGGESE